MNNKILYVSGIALIALAFSVAAINVYADKGAGNGFTLNQQSNIVVYNPSHQVVLNVTASGQVTIGTTPYVVGLTYYDSSGGHRLAYPLGSTVIVTPNA